MEQLITEALQILHDGEAIPESMDEELGTLLYGDFSAHAEIAEVFRALPPERATVLVRDKISVMAQAALAAAAASDDPEITALVLDTTGSVKELHEIENFAFGLSLYGDVVVDRVSERLRGNPSTTAAQTLTRALAKMRSSKAAPVLVEVLAHKNAAVRAEASRGLEALDEAAVPSLEEAAGGKAKALAKRARTVLGQLPCRLLELDNPLGEVLRAEAALDDETRSRVRQTIANQFEVDVTLPDGRIAHEYDPSPLVEELGAVAFAAGRADFLALIPERPAGLGGGRGYAGLWGMLVSRLARDERTAWIVLDTFARLPKFTKSITNHEWTSVWNSMYGAMAGVFGPSSVPGFGVTALEPLSWVLSNVPTAQEAQLKKWRKHLEAIRDL